MRVRVHAEPPLRLSAIVGDCLYTLRSSLDHLAWQLASLNGPPPSGTEFPIFTDCGAYHRLSRGKPARGSGLYKTRGIAPAEQALIEQSQPYNRPSDPEADPLWILHSLCNIDKHRVLHLTGGTIQGSSFAVLTHGAQVEHLEAARQFVDFKVDGVAALRRGDPAAVARQEDVTVEQAVDRFLAQHEVDAATKGKLTRELEQAKRQFGPRLLRELRPDGSPRGSSR
jgi:hypothetical protein